MDVKLSSTELRRQIKRQTEQLTKFSECNDFYWQLDMRSKIVLEKMITLASTYSEAMTTYAIALEKKILAKAAKKAIELCDEPCLLREWTKNAPTLCLKRKARKKLKQLQFEH